MSPDQKPDPLLEWGSEAAVIVFVAGILAALAVVIYSVMEGGSLESSSVPAVSLIAIGAVVAFGIMALRKRRERAVRPQWMGSTQEWQEGVHSRLGLSQPSEREGTSSPPPGES